MYVDVKFVIATGEFKILTVWLGMWDFYCWRYCILMVHTPGTRGNSDIEVEE